MKIFLVAIGGAAGSTLRYMTAQFVSRIFPGMIPWGTLAVNVVGCLIAGFLAGYFAGKDEQTGLRLLLLTGFCGGYTTFSAFSVENVALVQSGNPLAAAVYAGGSLVTGFLAVWLGLILAR